LRIAQVEVRVPFVADGELGCDRTSRGHAARLARASPPARTADVGSEETRGLVHPQDPASAALRKSRSVAARDVLLARANYLLSRATLDLVQPPGPAGK